VINSFVLAAETPDGNWQSRLGAAPPIYSREINYWLFAAAIDILRHRPEIGLLYIHTTDYPMHMWPADAGESQEHLSRLDALLGELSATAPNGAIRGIAFGKFLTMRLPIVACARIDSTRGILSLRAEDGMEAFAACFEGLDDPRTGNAGRHDLLEILMIALCTVLCGGQTAVDMHIFASAKKGPPVSTRRNIGASPTL
jgi:hypothetical protein